MRAITIAMLIGFRCSVFAGLFDSYYSSGQMDHKQYEFKISQGDILRTPVWASDADFPPLSTRKAQEIARQQMQELRGGAKPHWELRETTIADMGDGMHFVYVIEFEPPPDGQGCIGCDFMRLLVLMDGTVAKASVKPLSP
jgi:hypothetical protein